MRNYTEKQLCRQKHTFLLFIAFLSFVAGAFAYFYIHDSTVVKSENFVSTAPFEQVKMPGTQNKRKVSTQKTQYLDSVELLPSELKDYQKEETPIIFGNFSDVRIDYETDLSETVDGRIIILHTF